MTQVAEKPSEATYYQYEDGHLAKGEVTINGVKYRFDEDCVLDADLTTLEELDDIKDNVNIIKEIRGEKYVILDGKRAINKWIKVEENGMPREVKTSLEADYRTNEYGRVYTKKLIEVDENEYYCEETGYLAKKVWKKEGYITTNNSMYAVYYFGEDGAKCKNMKINPEDKIATYIIDENGKILNRAWIAEIKENGRIIYRKVENPDNATYHATQYNSISINTKVYFAPNKTYYKFDQYGHFKKIDD